MKVRACDLLGRTRILEIVYHPGLSSIPGGQLRPLVMHLQHLHDEDLSDPAFAVTKSCLTRRLRCHQPPRDNTFSSGL